MRTLKIIAAWSLLTLAWCAFVIVLAGRLMAQAPGCYVIDRYQQLCIPSDGLIFVDVAGLSADPDSARRHRKMAGDQAHFSNIRVSIHAAATLSIIPAPPIIASDGIVLAHDGYTQWTQPHRPGTSCCNKQDCEPVEARFDEKTGRYYARIGREWREIPAHIVLDPRKPENHNPDGSFHACWNRSTGELLCFREAEPKI